MARALRTSDASCSRLLPAPAAILVLVLAVDAAPAAAETLSGRVVGIADGDTLTILDGSNQQHRIRLSGIDAPEKQQPFGNVSKQNLARLAFGRHTVADCPKLDRYGRQICVVRVTGKDVGLGQLEARLVWWYRKYAKEQSSQDRDRYARAEDEARAANAGLWREPQPIPPWEWRHARRTTSVSTDSH